VASGRIEGQGLRRIGHVFFHARDSIVVGQPVRPGVDLTLDGLERDGVDGGGVIHPEDLGAGFEVYRDAIQIRHLEDGERSGRGGVDVRQHRDVPFSGYLVCLAYEVDGDVGDRLDYDKEALAYMQQTSDIAHNKDNLGYDLQEAGLNKDEQQARLRDRLQALDIQAQRLGVNRQELQNKLQTALANLGLDRQISMGQLTDMMNSANNGNNQLLNNIIQQAMAVGQTTKPVQRRTAPLPTRRRTATNRGPVAFSRKTR